ncbi:MAG: hypothetical protein AB7N70_04850 [Dehalococcoidia bacterium]
MSEREVIDVVILEHCPHAVCSCATKRIAALEALARRALLHLRRISPTAATEGYRLLEWGMTDEAIELQNELKAIDTILSNPLAVALLEREEGG